MDYHSDDIRKYIILTESSELSSTDEDIIDDIEIADIDVSEMVLEDVNDTIFKLRSYSENDNSIEYARGVEEGLALAANMLERILERYTSYTQK